jgi:protein O-GlcNAc transferase
MPASPRQSSAQMSRRFHKSPATGRAPPATPVASPVAEALHDAVALHQRGRFAEAEEIYRKIIETAPDHFDARHLLGVLKHQLGRHAEAHELIGTALQKQPNAVVALSNHATVLNALERYGEALARCDRAIVLKPDYPEALNNRGNALRGLGRPIEALASYDRAIALKPGYPEAFNNRGNALRDLGRRDEALASYDQAVALKADYANALTSRGDLLCDLDRGDEAIASCDAAIALKPHYAEAFCVRGKALAGLGRRGEALASYEQAIAHKPDYAGAFINRGNLLKDLARLDDALASYDRAIALKADDPDAFNNRGIVLQELGRLDEAVTSYDKAIALRPSYAKAFNNRGITLSAMRRPEDALADYDRAIALNPAYGEAFSNRGNVLTDLKRFDDALTSYERAIALKPDHADAFYSRGIALKELKRLDESLASYDHAIALRPDYADAFHNRGNVLTELKRRDEALTSYERALAIKPDHPYALSGLADCALRICDWTRTEGLAGEIEAHVAQRRSVVTPFVCLCYSSSPALQHQCAQTYVHDNIPVMPPALWNGTARNHDRIRIGYLSADFHHHATAFLMAELFELHDRSRFEVLGFSLGLDDGSEMRARLVKSFDRFDDVRRKSDRTAAALMNACEVDIAVDLKGYTQDARPGILGYRPAPVAVSFLGFPATMGAPFIDYVIADKIVLPFAEQPHWTERIVHLPDCYQVNDSRRKIAAATPSRRDAGLPESGFVFCSFNNNYKITSQVFDVWMRLLRSVEGSVLWLLRDNAGAETNLRREAGARGVAPARLVFADRTSLEDHLARHRLADLFLDTLPVNAHTTASDALWAGLPLVTCCGTTFAGRVAASLLEAVGLPELVTHGLADYEAVALALANDVSRLRAVRFKLEQNRLTCPLFDADRFRRHLEAAYTTMWDLHRRGESPRSFSVAAGAEAVA